VSARNDLLSALTTALDPALFRVSGAVNTPDAIDTGKLAIRVITKTVTPTPEAPLGLLTYVTELWMVSGKADPDTVDDALDAGIDPLLEALLALPFVQFVSAARGVMDDVWHGYLFTLNLYAQTGA
jgi:hypothetical protein